MRQADHAQFSIVAGVQVVVPWRGGCPHREAALHWVTARWAALGYEVRLGEHNDGPWSKARAVDAALGDTDVVVMTDADAWTDGVTEAIERVRNGAPWVIPHLRVHRLSPDATQTVLGGAEPHEDMPLDSFVDGVPGMAYPGVQGGGIVVCRRDVYDAAPLDPRFEGWGQEDEAWGLALRCLFGPPARLGYPLWHLWHPPQERLNRGTGSEAGLDLYRQYARAKRRPDEMRALIAEAR